MTIQWEEPIVGTDCWLRETEHTEELSGTLSVHTVTISVVRKTPSGDLREILGAFPARGMTYQGARENAASAARRELSDPKKLGRTYGTP